jgi:anti-sigma B factor antagonist
VADLPDFDVIVEASDGAIVARLRGELDVHTGSTLREITPTLTPSELRSLHLDLGALEFCDSRGLAQLVALRNAARDRGATFQVTGVGGQVARVLEHTGLDRALLH